MNRCEAIDNGRSLFRSAMNLQTASLDLDAMMKSLWEIISETTFSGNQVEDLKHEVGGNRGWVTPSYAYNFAIMYYPEHAHGQKVKNRKPTQVGTISMIVRLCNTGEIDETAPNWPWLDQACLILGWHPKEHPYDIWGINDFCPEDENQAYISHLENGLWSWRDEVDKTDYAHFFVLPIFALASEADLKRLVLRPLKTLIESNNPRTASLDALNLVPVLVPRPD